MLLVEWITRGNKHSFTIHQIPINKWIRKSIYIVIALLIIWFGHFGYHQFIYFQF